MIEKFERGGISFQYPANWTLETVEDEDLEEGQWAVTLQSPATAVLMVTHTEMEPGGAVDIADEVLETLQEDYEELDSEIAIERLAGQTAVGHDVDLLTLDTPVVVKIRAFETSQGALLIVCQFSEPDRAHYEPLLQAVLASLTVV